MATQMNREDVILALVAALRLRSALAGVQVESGHPGDETANEAVWVGDVEGDLGHPTMEATRSQRDDEFELPLAFQVTNNGTLDDTRARLGVLMAEVESFLADHDALGSVDGLVSIEATRAGSSVGRTPDGAMARGGLMVAVHVRLT
jgi:hypothetical protein